MLRTSHPHPRLGRLLPEPNELVTFWRSAGPDLWFAGDGAFGQNFVNRFAGIYEAARSEGLDRWENSAAGALGLAIVFDQYPRKAYRGRPEMYATDEAARQVADRAIGRNFDRMVERYLRPFYYLPFTRSEAIADEDRAVALCEACGEPYAGRARRRREIVRRFGRFPHRNAILGRTSTPEEEAWLAEHGPVT